MTTRRMQMTVLFGLLVLLGVVIWAVVDPKAAGSGWLVGFLFWMQIMTGSLCLMLIHRLTSGHWGELIAPVVVPMAAMLPLLFLLAIPLFIAIPVLYPWAQQSTAVAHDVLSIYLNRPIFIARSLLALAGWSVLALLLPRVHGARSQFLAAIGLVFYAISISIVSIDWYLSIEAPFTSSSFGASVAISSLMAALSWAAVWLPVRDNSPAVGDVGALLLTTVLGLTYIDFMAVLVIWYGDLPREVSWFVIRSGVPWAELGVAAFVLASLFPVVFLIQSRFRNHRRPLQCIGAVTLLGLAAYDVYLVAPVDGIAALCPALLATVGIGLVVSGVRPWLAGVVSSRREVVDAR